MKNNAMAIGVRTRIIYAALAIMTIILSMGENTMAQTKSTTVVKNIVLVNRDRQESEVSLAKGRATLKRLVGWFLN
jgi:hypothetical protein